MSYHEGTNWQARKEDEGKPLYPDNKNQNAYTSEEFTKLWNSLNTLSGYFDSVTITIPKKYRDYVRNELEARYGKIEGSRTFLSGCEIVFI